MDGIRCLQVLAAHPGPIGARELARQLDMEVTRAHRLLKTLAHMGMARQNRNSKYMPGPATHVLAAQSLYSSGLISNSMGPLLNLHQQVNLIVAFGMLWDRNVYYLYHLMPGMSAQDAVGRMRLQPASQSGIGMMLLSKKSDEEILEIYEGVDEIPGYPGGIYSMLGEIQRIRELGYAYHPVDVTTDRWSLAMMSDNNYYTSAAVAGIIPEERIPELSKAISDTLQRIFPEAP